MCNRKLYACVLIILLGCLAQGCGENDAALTPSLEALHPGASATLPASLPPTAISTDAIITLTPLPATPLPATAVVGSPTTPALPPLLPGYLAFSVWGTPPHGIALINADGSGWRWVTDSYPVGIYDEPTWSPDGHWIAFTLGFYDGSDDEIYIVNINGTDPQQLTFDDYLNNFLAWSPDGQQIAFTAPELYFLNRENGGTRRIGATLQETGGMAWSPDGTQIAFRAASQAGGYYLFMVDATGEDLKQVTDFQVGSGRISWSPDGQRIAYRSAEGCGDICILNLEDGTHQCLTNTTSGERDPAWSPDGRVIAFLATPETGLCRNQVAEEPLIPGWQVYLMAADGTGVTRLTNTSEIYYGLAWSPVPGLQIGGAYAITAWGDRLTLRASPSLSGAVITTLLEGDLVTILEGPVDVEDYYWWKMRTVDGKEGWAVEVYRWYRPAGE